MTTTFQLTIDCHDPARLVRFWSDALGYQVADPPEGHATWNDFWRSIGVPEDELDSEADGVDFIVDPTGAGPRIWFQQVPETKQIKNRLHLDLAVSGGRSVPLDVRKPKVDAESQRLTAAGATVVSVHSTEGLDHYGITMQDPEGNEFCLNLFKR